MLPRCEICAVVGAWAGQWHARTGATEGRSTRPSSLASATARPAQHAATGPPRSTAGAPGGVVLAAVMFFFSNRLGCGGSLLVSLVGTLLLLLLFGVIDL